jgi:hypothetical protein
MQTTPTESAAWAEAQVCRSRAARSDNRPFVRLAASRQELPVSSGPLTDVHGYIAAPSPAMHSREGVAGCDDPEDVHRWPLAWIAAGFVLGALDSPMARVLLALLGVPALMFLASLTATLVR